uniref:Mos1 transposase HTH domain-containing protein n=1 Tax=Heliothis virescens TaxID=7102 RepID=A0A2A4K4B1_HELVI
MSAVVNTMDMQQIEFRAVIKFLTKQGKGPQTILSEMQAVYGAQCPRKTMVYKWYGLFQQGREMIEDKPRALSFKRRRREHSTENNTEHNTENNTDHNTENNTDHNTENNTDHNTEYSTEPTPMFTEIPPKEIDFMDSSFDDEAFIDELQNEYLDSEP